MQSLTTTFPYGEIFIRTDLHGILSLLITHGPVRQVLVVSDRALLFVTPVHHALRSHQIRSTR